MNNLLYFYGQECPDCIRMQRRIERLEQELGVQLVHYEVWHNTENDALCMKYDTDGCGGVPFFYNTQTQKSLCGEVTYRELVEWASST